MDANGTAATCPTCLEVLRLLRRTIGETDAAVATVTAPAPVTSPPPVLTLAELAGLVRASERTVLRAAAREAIPGRVVAPRHARHRRHLYHRPAVEKWIAAGMPGLFAPRGR